MVICDVSWGVRLSSASSEESRKATAASMGFLPAPVSVRRARVRLAPKLDSTSRGVHSRVLITANSNSKLESKT